MIDYRIRTNKLVMFPFRLLVVVAVMAICAEGPTLCIAALKDDGNLLTPEVINRYHRDEIKTIQNNLKAIGYNPKEIDGVVGPHTKTAVNKLWADIEGVICCDSFEKLTTIIGLLVAAAKEEPEWKKILLAPDFKQWLATENLRHDSVPCRFWEILSPDDLIKLFKAYKAQDAPAFERTADYIVSYQLTSSDLEKWQTEDDLLVRLKKLAGKPFAGRGAFADAIREAASLKNPDFYHTLDSVLKDISAQATYTLTEASLSELKDEQIPEVVLEKLMPLQNVEYQGYQKFNMKVQPILDQVINQYREKILSAAEVPQACTLTNESLGNLKIDLPERLYASLKEYEGRTFKSKKELQTKIRRVIEQITRDYDYPDKTLEEFATLKSEPSTSQRKKALEKINRENRSYKDYEEKILKMIVCHKGYAITEANIKEFAEEGMPDFIQGFLYGFIDLGIMKPESFRAILEERIDNYAQVCRQKIDDHAYYRLTEQSLAKLSDKPFSQKMPDALIEWLQKNFQDIDYADQHLFQSAFRFKFNQLEQQYLATVQRVLENIDSLNDSATLLAKLKAEFSKKGLPYDFQVLKIQVDKYCCNDTQWKSALLDEIHTGIDAWRKYEPRISNVARKERLFALDGMNRPAEINWKGESCGCVLGDLSETTVYGFYPFWLSDHQNGSPKEKFNFSVLSRIGYYAQPINKTGQLALDPGWQLERNAAFIETAHKYRTKVDLVIYGIDWPQLIANKSDGEIAGAFVDLIEDQDIDAGAWTRFLLTTFPWHWFTSYSNLKSVVDGINIDFEGFPTDLASRSFVDFIKTIKVKLREANPSYSLNIMLPMNQIGRGKFSYENLERLIGANGEASTIDLLLVFIDEPTTDSKKALRQKIEDNLRGPVRIEVLRKIIPVVTFSGGNQGLKQAEIDELMRQLKDDILYSQYNYGGIGFWPVPRVDTNGSNAVHMALQEIFRAPYADQSIFEEAATQICTWVCPQRGYFRFAADIIVVLVAVLILRFAFSCNTRHSFEQNKKYVIGVLLIVAILILLIAALLYCDPYYQKIREGNLPLFVLILMVFVVSIWLYRRHAKRSQNP